jgi:hypothetical protein
MKFVKRPGYCRAFSFCRRIASPPAACKFLAYAYFYLVPFRAVHLCGLSKPLPAEKILTPVIDRAAFETATRLHGRIEDHRRVTLLRRAKKNALA